MGEYAHHSDPRKDDIKIGVVNEALFTRQALLNLRAQGYGGNELDRLIDSEDTVFPLFDDGPYRATLGPIMVPHTALVEVTCEWWGPPHYSADLAACTLHDDTMNVVLVGMKQRDGHLYTVLACPACGKTYALADRSVAGDVPSDVDSVLIPIVPQTPATVSVIGVEEDGAAHDFLAFEDANEAKAYFDAATERESDAFGRGSLVTGSEEGMYSYSGPDGYRLHLLTVPVQKRSSVAQVFADSR